MAEPCSGLPSTSSTCDFVTLLTIPLSKSCRLFKAAPFSGRESSSSSSLCLETLLARPLSKIALVLLAVPVAGLNSSCERKKNVKIDDGDDDGNDYDDGDIAKM